RVDEEADSEVTDSLEKYLGEGEDESEGGGDEEEEPEKDKEPHVFSVYDSEEESGEENQEFVFAWHKGTQDEEGTEDMKVDEKDAKEQGAISLTKE
ncbi:hypothetical protein KI387_039211, partial [Taxus chinensis]